MLPKKPQSLVISTHSLMGPFAGVSSLAQSLGGHKMSSFLHSAWLNPLQRDYKEHFSRWLLPSQRGPLGCDPPGLALGRWAAATLCDYGYRAWIGMGCGRLGVSEVKLLSTAR